MGAMTSGIRQLGKLTRLFMNARVRDYYATFGYKPTLTFDDFLAKYLRQDVAARIVDAPASALWTNPPEVKSSSEEWNRIWQDIVARNSLFSVIERADKLAGLGRYSVILIGFNDGGKLDTPVNRKYLNRKNTKILFLQQYSERSAKIDAYNLDTTSEDYMKPLLYSINPLQEIPLGFDKQGNSVISKGQTIPGTFQVHASRVIHIAENALENDIYGSPRLERVFNTLDDLIKVVGGSSETYWLTANRGLHINVDKTLDIDPEDAKNLSDEVDEYSEGLRRIIRTRGVDVKNLGSDTPDPTGNFNMLISVLSGASGIPKRILIGAEAGQLASEQDRANWADRVDERRANFGNTVVVFQIIKKLTRAGVLPGDQSLTITCVWPSAFKMSPLESAQTSAQHARSVTNFAKAIETMENLKRGEPGSAEQIDPETGKAIPGSGKPAVEGVTFNEELITIDEARQMIGLKKPNVTFDSGDDVGGDS